MFAVSVFAPHVSYLTLILTGLGFGTAFAFESANKTWQRLLGHLSGDGQGTSAPYNTGSPNPGIQQAFKILKSYLSQFKGNPDMQLITFAASDLSTAGGLLLGSGAAKLVGVYVVKSGASGTGNATACYVKLSDSATDDTTAGNNRVAIPLLAAGDARVYIDPQGLALANGLVVNGDTTLLGTTDSATADGGPGFAIVANF